MVCNNHHKKVKAPFVIYADFECLTEKYGTFSIKSKNTAAYQKHTPCGLMINIVIALLIHLNHTYTEVMIAQMTKNMIEVKNDI